MMQAVHVASMMEVICEDCQTAQTTTDIEAPECDACGSRSLTTTTGYETPSSPTA